jgi:hypothetical protein
MLCVAGAPASAQHDAWKNQWYWGAQLGTFIFSTPTVSNEVALSIGGHWLITGDRVGLNIAIDQIMFGDGTTSAITDGGSVGGARSIGFTSGRRIQAELYAIPTSGVLQVFAGGGFAIHQVTDALALGTFVSPQEETILTQIVDEVSTKAFLVIAAGFQYRVGKWALFGKYQFMPEGRDFLLSGEQHAISGGLRFALTAASEDVTTER